MSFGFGKARTLTLAAVAASAAIMAAPGAAHANLLTNGDFETGTLAGWTVFDTANGTAGENLGLPDVVQFDVTGNGATFAAQLQVGHTSGAIFTNPGGGGLSQSVTVGSAGTLTVSFDFAAPNAGNADAGTILLLLDGTVLASDALGPASGTNRGSLSGSTLVGAGSHTVSLEAEREFLNGSVLGDTPFQFFDNAVADFAPAAAVPEPATLALFGAGLAGLGLFRRRKRA